mgnify:FL=1
MTMKKRVFLLALLFVGFMNLVNAQQGKWAGTVKYQLSWTGEIPKGVQLPTEWETKVFENKTKTMSFSWAMMLGLPATELTDAAKKTITYTCDFSMIPVDELNGKWFIKKKITDADFAEISYKETGNTKEMAGKKVKEIICTSKDKDGADVTETIWACDEIGPMMDLMYYPGLKAMPFEFKIDLDDKISCQFTVSELTEGKVKNTELIMEAGYDELTEEEFLEKLKSVSGGEESGDEDF